MDIYKIFKFEAALGLPAVAPERQNDLVHGHSRNVEMWLQVFADEATG